MKAVTTLAIFVLTLFVVSVAVETPAEAKGGQVAKNVGKGVGNSVRSVGKGIYSSTRYVTNGIYQSARWGARTLWVGAGLGAGAAMVTNNCNYYAKRYNETRNTKWRDKYNRCIR